MKEDQKTTVTIYGAEWCPPCHVIKEYLNGRKVSYSYVNIDEDRQGGMDIAKKTGWSSIPIVQIGDEYILGFDRAKIDEALRHHKLIS